jgi:transposase
MPTSDERQQRNQAILLDYQSNMRVVDIAAKHGISTDMVSRVVKQLGGSVRSQGYQPKLDDTQKRLVATLSAQGMPAAELASRFGITSMTVYNILKEYSGQQTGVEFCRGCGMFDGAKSVDEMIQHLEAGVQWLRQKKAAGWRLQSVVANDYAVLVK